MLGDERPEPVSSDGEGLPDGAAKTKGKPGRKPGKLKESIAGLSAEAMQLIAAMGEQNKAAMVEFAKEIRKPTPKEEREEEENRKKEERIRQNRLTQLENAKKQALAEEARLTSCSHAFYNPATKITNHAWGGQVSTPAGQNPYFIPICGICKYQLKDEHGNLLKFPATMDMITGGVNLDQIPYLDVDKLRAWYKQATEQQNREMKAKALAVA